MKKSIFTLAVIFMLSAKVSAQEVPEADKFVFDTDTVAVDWTYVTQSIPGDAKWYMNQEIIYNKNGNVKIWIKCINKTFTYEKKIYKDSEAL